MICKKLLKQNQIQMQIGGLEGHKAELDIFITKSSKDSFLLQADLKKHRIC